MKNKVKILIKTIKKPCYFCSPSPCGTPIARNKCKPCKGTGIYNEHTAYFITTEKNGKKYATDSDNIG